MLNAKAVTGQEARGAAPFTVGTGDTPAGAVGIDGTGHVAWVVDDDAGRSHVAKARLLGAKQKRRRS